MPVSNYAPNGGYTGTGIEERFIHLDECDECARREREAILALQQVRRAAAGGGSSN